ncbi:MAG TPA: hypothetical protein VM120_07170 [Bryobacteraceae bacterium]|nr:hypothetical protein [Bryobacteraceae bacterium]
MTSATDSLAKIEDRITKLAAAECSLDSKLVAAEVELAAAETGSGDAVLAGVLEGNGDQAAAAAGAQVEAIRAKLQALQQGILSARYERHALLPKRLKAQADHLRAQALEMLTRADAKEAEIKPLLEALLTKTGCEYEPRRADSRSHNGGQVGGAPFLIRTVVPDFILWRDEASALVAAAIALENEVVNSNGTITASSLEELLARCADRYAVTPPSYILRGWARAEMDRDRSIPVPMMNNVRERYTLELTVHWRGGCLQADKSRASRAYAEYEEQADLLPAS